MAQLKTHLIKALDNRRKAIDAHRKATLRAAEMAETQAGLDAGVTAAGKIARVSTPPSGMKG